MAQVISFINYKGGVGKTTTAYHIGSALALYHGKRVLMIDVDPQTQFELTGLQHFRWRLLARTFSSEYCVRLKSTAAMATCCESNPGFALTMRYRPRSRKPAPLRRTSERATCPITRAARNRVLRTPEPGSPLLSELVRSTFRDCIAGRRAQSRPVARETRSVNARTAPSM